MQSALLSIGTLRTAVLPFVSLLCVRLELCELKTFRFGVGVQSALRPIGTLRTDDKCGYVIPLSFV